MGTRSGGGRRRRTFRPRKASWPGQSPTPSAGPVGAHTHMYKQS